MELKYPTSKMAQFVDMMASKEGVPLKIIPIDEYRFIFAILYEDLKNLIISLMSKKYDNLKVETSKNKILFYFNYGDKYILVEDLNQVAERIYEKFKVKIGIDVPSDNELLIIVRAEPLATKLAQIMLSLLKKKNNNIIRLFKFRKGEVELPKYGYALAVAVEYVNADVERLEDLVGKI